METTGAFELVKRAGPDTWLCVKRNDPRRVPYFAHKELPERRGELLSPSGSIQYPYHWRVRNHENIVSYAGAFTRDPVTESPQQQATEAYAVMDVCDASNLTSMLDLQPALDPRFYSPEDLCWHVLVSLMRAVAYLHDGKRINYKACPDAPLGERWLSSGRAWVSILHCDIVPKNIYFQHRRGTEKFGMCQLHGFQNATVTGNHVNNAPIDEDESGGNFAIAPFRGWEPVTLTYSKLDETQNLHQDEQRSYCLSDELWSIGSVIFTMMTSATLVRTCPEYGCDHVLRCSQQGCRVKAADKRGCKCQFGGCTHLSKTLCTHEGNAANMAIHPECRRPSINIDDRLAGLHYSRYLRDVVKTLLDCNQPGIIEFSALRAALVVEMSYREWKKNTRTGQMYRDLEDDLKMRWQAQVEAKAEDEVITEEGHEMKLE